MTRKPFKRIININRNKIASNKKHGRKEPIVSVKTYKSNDYGFEVEFTQGKLIYSPDNPIPCGATVWIETCEPVILDGKEI